MKKKLQSQIVIRYFVVVCWVAYFATYLGRLNYVASLNDMVRIGLLTKPEAGMIGTGFFLCYGIGQLFSGFLGDRIPSKWMCFTGIAGSAVINMAMAFTESSTGMLLLWCINGLAQSLTWAPIIKILSERLSREQCKKASVTMSTTVAIGTISAYALAALMIGVADWRGVFIASSLIVGGVSALWLVAIGRIEKVADGFVEEESESWVSVIPKKRDTDVVTDVVPVAGNIWSLLMAMGIVPIMLCIVLQGILKDGVMTWVPTYISEIYSLGSVTSILASIMLPITNLGGVYAAYYINSRYLRNEVKTSGVCFAITSGAILMLVLFGRYHVLIAVAALSITTSGMMGVNTMLISLLPLYFAQHNRVSTVTGILNSCAYAGSALSSYGIGLVAQFFDWEITIMIWFALALTGVVICLAMMHQWQKVSLEKA